MRYYDVPALELGAPTPSGLHSPTCTILVLVGRFFYLSVYLILAVPASVTMLLSSAMATRWIEFTV